jgi:DNA-binding transcriptional MocR family regulator
LRLSYPTAIDCTTGRTDPALLPLEVLRRAWREAVNETTANDLQYAGPQPVSPLIDALLPRLRADGIPARAEDLIIGSSAQQLMNLAVGVVASLHGSAELTIAVEEPGYQTAFDAFERAGHRLVGVSVDGYGAMPESLNAALGAGASVVLFTPRVQNPTGSSWSPRRRAELADVLTAYPSVVVIEDDQLAEIASGSVASLCVDPRIADRVIYIRSFAKAVAPDLRIAAAIAQTRLRTPLLEAKSFTDGWTSHFTQRTLAKALVDPELDEVFANAAKTYSARRAGVLGELSRRLRPLGGSATGPDGVNIWIQLPASIDAAEVIERAAQLGALAAPGEHFFIRPGRSDVVRLSIGSIGVEQAAIVGEIFATATATAGATTSAMSV